MQKGPEGPFLQNDFVATDFYFVAARLTAFAGAAAFGTALAATFAFGATGAGAAAVAGAAFSAVRWSRSTLISALILSLRPVSFAMPLLSFAMALAVLDTGAFFAAGLAAGLTTLVGVFTFAGAAALGAAFFAVAIFWFPFFFVELAKLFLPVQVLWSFFPAPSIGLGWGQWTWAKQANLCRYTRINTLFAGTVNWTLIQEHYPQFMQLALAMRIPLIVTGDSGIVTADSGDRDRAWCCAVWIVGCAVFFRRFWPFPVFGLGGFWFFE
jgi:hypothetical protein